MLKQIICLLTLTFLLASVAFGQATRFSVIGGYGYETAGYEARVAELVKSWNPDFIVTLGGNNYPNGENATIDKNIGKFFHEYIYNYQGIYGNGSASQKFFPSLGEDDYMTAGAAPYLDYFTLPGNERYYDFVKGDIHFFVLDSNPETPFGTTENGVQAMWLKENLASAPETWKIVCFYHSPYSSGAKGSNVYMRWSFKEWGATAVLSGQNNGYERLQVNDFLYIVNGLGGRSGDDFAKILPSSRFRYNENFGAMKIEANPNVIEFQFYNLNGLLVDSWALQALSPPASLTVKNVSGGYTLSWIDSSNSEEGFNVEKSFDGETFLPFGAVGANQTEFFVRQPRRNVKCFYRINAFRKETASLYSNTVLTAKR